MVSGLWLVISSWCLVVSKKWLVVKYVCVAGLMRRSKRDVIDYKIIIIM